ncbi:hypothetical protein [Crenobacter cavernae]|uniref:Uncharacterized protein n=1 Tax=Crenobacter cavernae TaxID=2290923 RepID=A0A345Y5X4_9NEIS|nr:hypothetical protein [Crenobacter cavernae]AXK39326.1 hypothetical protein DWG20_07720 [Crenobacter cavernae]
MSEQKRRDAFEAWANEHMGLHGLDRCALGGYLDNAVHDAWCAWAAALATLADRRSDEVEPPTVPDFETLVCELYQVLGALDAPQAVLDQVWAAIEGEPLPHATRLPFEAPVVEPDAALIAAADNALRFIAATHGVAGEPPVAGIALTAYALAGALAKYKTVEGREADRRMAEQIADSITPAPRQVKYADWRREHAARVAAEARLAEVAREQAAAKREASNIAMQPPAE